MAAMFLTVSSTNRLLVSSPDEALAIAGGLLAVGGALKLRQILTAVGDPKMTAEERAEVELLDEQAPTGFFGSALNSVHASLVGWKIRGSAVPKVFWKHGDWNVRHRGVTFTGDPMVDPAVKAYDWTDVSTLVMNESGELS